MAAVCEYYAIGPAAVRDATMGELDALIRRMEAASKARANAK